MRFTLLLAIAASVVAANFPSSSVTDTLYEVTTDPTKLLNATGTNGGYHKGQTLHTSQEGAYGTYNYCFMPHPRVDQYEVVENAELVYVQYVQRHQKRSPYNIFPAGEKVPYQCDQLKPYLYAGGTFNGAMVYADTYTSPNNPFVDTSANGTCQYPQLTIGGFNDGFQHGQDLWNLYGERLGLLPLLPNEKDVTFRSTESPLTQQTASGVIYGIWPFNDGPIPLKQQSNLVDTINQAYPCNKRGEFQSSYESTDQWKLHLSTIEPITNGLNVIAGTANNGGWLGTMDHFKDNFQARQCNGYDLPLGVSQSQANVIYNAGDWEWNYYYVAQPNVTEYVQAVEGLFVGEIIADLDAATKGSHVKFNHVFVHDNDIGPVAGALGIEALRWPGMGSNIAIELYKQRGKYFVRVLYCGSPIRSKHGNLSWIDYDTFRSTLSQYVPEDVVSFCNS